ncbi:unnamed protein product [Rhizoctonia solani]|uniref:Uncharacterized protein n=1 Tax=Rhizoctonia solani TaxID=456999 RepID=A0A8H2WWL0_9AGAM|nr:unnamed protein product [Rhizoctonia solani]
MASTEPAALKVFSISELTQLICSRTRKCDNVNLMRVCHQLFNNMLPLVWQTIDEANPLVSLIPGGGIVTYDSDLSPYVVMQLPDSLELSRFNIYAPHVKQLTPAVFHVDRHDGWEAFLSCTRSIDLLPNLITLDIPAPDSPWNRKGEIDANSMNWITVFLSASLRNLTLIPELIYSIPPSLPLSLPSFTQLMDSLPQKCPNLCSFSIFSGNVMGRSHRLHSSPARRVRFWGAVPETYSGFLQLSNLCSLTISSAALGAGAFHSLSSLPKLRSLSVIGSGIDYSMYSDYLDTPAEGFPALKFLQLIRLTWGTIANICNNKHIVSGLLTLIITLPYRSNRGFIEGERIPECFSDVAPLLATHNSSIVNLTILNHGDRRPYPEVLKAWSHFSLISLHLGWHVIRTCGYYSLFFILSCQPLLEDLKLSMAQIPFELQELRWIVELLPRLRCLQIPVNWGRIVEVSGELLPSPSQSNDILCLMSDFYLPEPQQGNAERLARCFSVLRPLSSVVCKSHVPYFYCYATREYVDEQPKDMINIELSRLKSK